MISSGFAGSVNPKVNVGDLVIGRHVLYSPQNGFEGEIQVDAALPCDKPMADLAMRLSSTSNLTSHYGDILSVNGIVYESSTKKSIGNQTSAIAVDMESFAIAKQASAMGVPFIVARAISDGADEDMRINEHMVTAGGNISISATTCYLLSKPHHILYLNRLHKQTKSAVNTLSAFFPNFITQIYNTLLT